MTSGTKELIFGIVLASMLVQAAPNRQDGSTTTTTQTADKALDAALEGSQKQAYFNQEASMDYETLAGMDCHMRNLDFCYAGMMGASTRLLPENDVQFEARCDEMKAATSCMNVFNRKCQSDRFLSMMGPMGGVMNDKEKPHTALAKLVGSEEEADKLLHQRVDKGLEDVIQQTTSVAAKDADKAPITVQTLITICEPSAKKDPANARLRAFMFRLGKCINTRAPRLQPCIDDIKTALLVFGQSKKIQVKPTCCAISRFQACMFDALDGACGVGSFKSVMAQFDSASPMGSLKSVEKICKGAGDHKSKECTDILPPSGMKVNDVIKKSGRNRLANALDLMSLSPAMQES